MLMTIDFSSKQSVCAIIFIKTFLMLNVSVYMRLVFLFIKILALFVF